MSLARVIEPAKQTYTGERTDPERWSSWQPREGDILVCTPPKCGTTWTQTMLTMLVYGGPDLPDKVPVLSPWVDADLGVAADEVAEALDRQKGRRVVKTHTPADGFPVWDGVSVIAVYRHPIDVYFSLRKHTDNMADNGGNPTMKLEAGAGFDAYLVGEMDRSDFDRDNLETIVHHYRETALSDRVNNGSVFHYADFLRNGRKAVESLARAADVQADDALIDRVAEATAFASMKAKAADYAPVGGTGFWKSDAAFFDSASSGKWEGRLSQEALDSYAQWMEREVPDARNRAWLNWGETGRP